MTTDQPYATNTERELLRLSAELREELRDIRRGLLSREVYEANRQADQARLAAIETQLAQLAAGAAAAARTEARLEAVEHHQQTSGGMGRGLLVAVIGALIIQVLVTVWTK